MNVSNELFVVNFGSRDLLLCMYMDIKQWSLDVWHNGTHRRRAYDNSITYELYDPSKVGSQIMQRKILSTQKYRKTFLSYTYSESEPMKEFHKPTLEINRDLRSLTSSGSNLSLCQDLRDLLPRPAGWASKISYLSMIFSKSFSTFLHPWMCSWWSCCCRSVSSRSGRTSSRSRRTFERLFTL